MENRSTQPASNRPVIEVKQASAALFAEDLVSWTLRALPRRSAELSEEQAVGLAVDVRRQSQYGHASVADTSRAAVNFAFQRATEKAGIEARLQTRWGPDVDFCPLYPGIRELVLAEGGRAIAAARAMSTFLENAVFTFRAIVQRVYIWTDGCASAENRFWSSLYIDGSVISQRGVKLNLNRGLSMREPGQIDNGMILRLIEEFEDAVERSRSAIKPQPGLTHIGFVQGGAGILFHEAAGHGLEACNFTSQPTTDSRLFSSSLNVADDPRLKEGFGSTCIDDCGQTTKRLDLISEGRVVGLFSDGLSTDCETGGVVHRPSYRHHPFTGMSNLIVQPGLLSQADLVEEVRNGVLVNAAAEGVIDQNGMIRMIIQEAQEIRSGEVVGALEPFTIEMPFQHVLSEVHSFTNKVESSPMYCGTRGSAIPVDCYAPGCAVPALKIIS